MDSITLAVCHVDRSKTPDATLPPIVGQDATVAVVTWIPVEKAFQIGLPRGAICGVLRDSTGGLVPENFIPNRDFIDILHYLNAHHLDPSLLEYVRSTSEPSVAVIDQRSPDVNAAIPPEDILGLYEIEDRQVVRYRPNPNYGLVTTRGTFFLTPWLRQCLVSAVLSKS
jgi:hypothetical protein